MHLQEKEREGEREQRAVQTLKYLSSWLAYLHFKDCDTWEHHGRLKFSFWGFWEKICTGCKFP